MTAATATAPVQPKPLGRRYAEVAVMLDVTEKTIARWVKTGKVAVVRMVPGGQPRIPESEVQRLLSGTT